MLKSLIISSFLMVCLILVGCPSTPDRGGYNASDLRSYDSTLNANYQNYSKKVKDIITKATESFAGVILIDMDIKAGSTYPQDIIENNNTLMMYYNNILKITKKMQEALDLLSPLSPLDSSNEIDAMISHNNNVWAIYSEAHALLLETVEGLDEALTAHYWRLNNFINDDENPGYSNPGRPERPRVSSAEITLKSALKKEDSKNISQYVNAASLSDLDKTTIRNIPASPSLK